MFFKNIDFALAGNRTYFRAAGENSTTEPPT